MTTVIDDISDLTEEKEEWYERKMNDFHDECYVCEQCHELVNQTNPITNGEGTIFNTIQELLDRYAKKRHSLKKGE